VAHVFAKHNNRKQKTENQKPQKMLPYAYYLLKVIICSGILFGYYWLLLRNKIYHRYNRFYLLVSVVLSLTMPLIQINIWHKQDAPAQSIQLLQVMTGGNEYLDEIVLTARQNNFTTEQFIMLLYLATSFIFCVVFIRVLFKIRTLLKQHRQTVADNICFVNTTAEGTPFSFLKYIFWNDNIDITTTTGNQIFKHELAHVQQKHSYDKLFINTILIFYWCNPFFWLVRKELNMIHEFMADKIAVENSDTEAFAAMILQATYPQHRFALTNPFFYSPIKRRLIMLTKNNNTKAGYIGRVLVLPLAALLFAAFTLKTKAIKSYGTPMYEGKKITVVIDAGHGGKDFGGQSPDGKIYEKDLTLTIIKKIKELNKNKNVNIILTRENDVYQSPKEKADFSIAQNPDLFVSIHIDAAIKDSAASKTGMSVLVADNTADNTASSKLFASAIINQFANNFKIPVTMFPRQQQAGIWVLKQSICPAILIEAGYITNKKDLAYLQTDEAKEAIAKNVLAAIEKYVVATQSSEKGISILPTVSYQNMHIKETDTLPETIAKHGKAENNSVVSIKTKTNELIFHDLPVTIKEDSITKKLVISGNITIDNIESGQKPDKQPMYILNGKIQTSEFILNSISTDEIESINVLKNNWATEKYGDKAINGAIEINTKKIIKPTTVVIQPGGEIFSQVENEAKFPGGDSAWRRYLEKNLNPGIPVNNGAPQGVYRVIVKFIVNKDGSISDVKAETKHGYGMDSAAVELIKKVPKWDPAIQNNHTVTAYKKQPITFVIEGEK
jgi:N-acetylmuramoyl-L-alanine amidase